ncbi:MAG: alkaline phosphatase [Calothrix sp. C42_A2020_038]|nr:alkaline phosphatase [Calothrix sp. C42_A2020_038]
MRLINQVISAILFSLLIVGGCTPGNTSGQGNVIFIHPDGASVSHWGAGRMVHYGPDGRLNWDKMSNLGVYLGHMKNQLTATSNGGAVTHATGVKVNADSFGLDENLRPVIAASGKDQTIIQEAIAAGKSTAIINSGMIHEPGTAAFVAKVPTRRNFAEITKQVVESNVDIILGGGEMWYLPQGTAGRHTTAEQSQRVDGVNLIEVAKQKGYTVVYTSDELLKLPSNTQKILGIFAADDTYNDATEEQLKQENKSLYVPTAPTVAQMLDVTLKNLAAKNKNFIVVLEEEGTDNFANYNNAVGTIEALKRADDAIGVAMKFVESNPNTLILTAADSDAGGMEVIGVTENSFPFDKPVPEKSENGAPWDGKEGTGTPPFVSAPDKQGKRFPFAVGWSSGGDNAGSIVSKAHGLNADKLPNTLDNTDIYRLMYLTLFGKEIQPYTS